MYGNRQIKLGGKLKLSGKNGELLSHCRCLDIAVQSDFAHGGKTGVVRVRTQKVFKGRECRFSFLFFREKKGMNSRGLVQAVGVRGGARRLKARRKPGAHKNVGDTGGAGFMNELGPVFIKGRTVEVTVRVNKACGHRRSFLPDRAVYKAQDAVAACCNRVVVRDDYGRSPAFAGAFGKNVKNGDGGFGVKVPGRLIGEDADGISSQGAGHRRSLTLAPREFRRKVLEPFAQAHFSQKCFGLGKRLSRGTRAIRSGIAAFSRAVNSGSRW